MSTKTNNKVYIDLGAMKGESVEKFIRKYNHEGYLIYAFDPAIYRYPGEWERLRRKHENLILESQAAWIFNGEIEFTLREENRPYGSSAMKEKTGWGDGKIITVRCFDFSGWIKQFENHYVVVKMNIEGAEYPILKRMIKDGTDEIMNELIIEWHSAKMPNYETNEEWIKKNLKCKVSTL